MSLKPPSILHSLDSMGVLVGRLVTSIALYITIAEVPAIREVSLDDPWRFFSKFHKRDSTSQSSFTAITGTKHVINALL